MQHVNFREFFGLALSPSSPPSREKDSATGSYNILDANSISVSMRKSGNRTCGASTNICQCALYTNLPKHLELAHLLVLRIIINQLEERSDFGFHILHLLQHLTRTSLNNQRMVQVAPPKSLKNLEVSNYTSNRIPKPEL